jgi:hypothetical protein
MAVYRAKAELRRLYREAPWQVSGVVVGGAWHSAAPGLLPGSAILVAAELCCVIDLPAFIAPSDRVAARVALDVAHMEGYLPVRGPDLPTYRVSVGSVRT